MKKSEMQFGFKSLEIINIQIRDFRKRIISPSLSYLHPLTEKHKGSYVHYKTMIIPGRQRYPRQVNGTGQNS